MHFIIHNITMQYKRILLKLSGESLSGKSGSGIDFDRLKEYTEQIAEITLLGVQTGIVIGGGNIFRGLSGSAKGFDRYKGDQMGMLATVINSLALSSALEDAGITSRVMTAIRMEPIGELYSKPKAIEALNKGEVVIFSAGTGNPFFTTDTGATLRGIEIEADIIQEEAKLKENLGLDSLDFVDIVVIVERTFGFKIKPEDMANVLTVKDFYDYIDTNVTK